MNRVLTLEQVKALPEGARVHLECRYAPRWDEVVTWRCNCGDNVLAGSRCDTDLNDIELQHGYGTHWRVWSLPVAPTPDELAAWPWEKEAKDA